MVKLTPTRKTERSLEGQFIGERFIGKMLHLGKARKVNLQAHQSTTGQRFVFLSVGASGHKLKFTE